MRTYHRIIFGDSRDMGKVDDESIHLVVTSPPYWQLKDYEAEGQIGFDNSYQEYIENLNLVWEECYRVLHPGCRLCINIGDQFARSIYYGRYKVIPIRTEIIKFCESISFDYMGAIIWQKVTTCNTSGGASVMGSYPYPRNGILKLDYEFILIFKKLGKAPRPEAKMKEESRLTQDEWNEFFSGHWNFPGAKQDKHLAMFPVELPLRLIRMFTFKGETILDPFLGSGTTTEAALRSERHSTGYEIQRQFEHIIKQRIAGIDDSMFIPDFNISYQPGFPPDLKDLNDRKSKWPFSPIVPDLKLKTNPKKVRFKSRVALDQKKDEPPNRIIEVIDCNRLLLDSGEEIELLGVKIPHKLMANSKLRDAALDYLAQLVVGKRVELKFDATNRVDGRLAAYVILPNKTHVNAKIIKAGYALADGSLNYRFKERFERYSSTAKEAKIGIWEEH